MVLGLIHLFIDNLLPVLLIAGAGALVRRLLNVEPKPLSEVTFYVFMPSLVFGLLLSTQADVLSLLKMVGFAATVILSMGVVGLFVGRLFGLRGRQAAGLLMVVMFMNAGNLGLAVTQFSFGEQALVWATVFFMTSSMMSNSLGVYIASVGRSSARQALVGLAKVPVIYAIVLALALREFGWTVPLPLMRAVDLAGGAAIPMMLVILGMQVARIRLPDSKRLLGVAVGLRLLLSPAIGLALATLLGMSGPERQAGVLEAAMPAAVLNTMLAVKFDIEPDFIAAVVLFGTVLSPLTLTPLIGYLGHL